MHKFYQSAYDASIYLQLPEQNAGRDEVIEIGKTFYGKKRDVSRTLIKFDTTELSQSRTGSADLDSWRAPGASFVANARASAVCRIRIHAG